MLAGHIATKSLSEQGMLLFTGAATVFESPVYYASGYYFAKTATHALAMNMSEKDCLPETATVVTILPGMLDTKANREAMPDMDTNTWLPTEKLAVVIQKWADGENRPENGSYVKLDYANEVLT